MTNGDLIRKMSNEELGNTIMCPGSKGAGLAELDCGDPHGRNCRECTLNWLNQEVEEE